MVWFVWPLMGLAGVSFLYIGAVWEKYYEHLRWPEDLLVDHARLRPLREGTP